MPIQTVSNNAVIGSPADVNVVAVAGSAFSSTGPAPVGGPADAFQSAAVPGSEAAFWSTYQGSVPVPAGRSIQRALDTLVATLPHPEQDRRRLMDVEGVLRMYVDGGFTGLAGA